MNVNRSASETTHGFVECTACHGGDRTLLDLTGAHASVVARPLARPDSVYSLCHSDFTLVTRSPHESWIPSAEFPELEGVHSETTVGNIDAPIQIEFWYDYLCPWSALAYRMIIIPLLETEVPDGRVQISFWNLASLGPGSEQAAAAATCAASQGGFLEFHNALLRLLEAEELGEGNEIPVSILSAAAEEAQLNVESFLACLNSSDIDLLVKEEHALGQRLRVMTTPTFFVNGRRMTGYVSPQRFNQMVLGGRASP